MVVAQLGYTPRLTRDIVRYAALGYAGTSRDNTRQQGKGMADTLEQADYVSFSTLRKNGNWVDTPVWFAPEGSTYYIFSAGNAGKVKRLRNFRQCKLAPCTMTGKHTGGQVEGHAWLVNDTQEISIANRALLRKYGWQMRLANLGSHLTGKYNKRQLIGFKLGGEES